MKKHHLFLILLLAVTAAVFLNQSRNLKSRESSASDELSMLREAVKRLPAEGTASNLTARSSRPPAIDIVEFCADLSGVLKSGEGVESRKTMENFVRKYQAQIAAAPLSKLKEICALIEKEFPLDQKDSEVARQAWLFIIGQAAKSDPAWAFSKFDEAATAAKAPVGEALGIFRDWSSQNGEPMNSAYATALQKWLDAAQAEGRIDGANPIVAQLRADIATAQGNQAAAIKQISKLPYLKQRQAAINYVESLQTTEARQQAMKELSSALHGQNFPHFVRELADQQGFEAAREILASATLTPEKHDLAAASIAASDIGPETPAKAKWLLESLRGDDKHAIIQFTDRWTHADYHGAAQWIGSLPEGNQRDSAITGFAPAAAKIDGATAMDWALTLTDPDQRRACLDDVLRKWRQTDAEAADAYLRENGMDAR